MSSDISVTSIGNLEQALNIFEYLKSHPKRKLGFDPAHPATNENRLQCCDWAEDYLNVSESILWNNPLPRGNCMPTH